MSKCFRSKKRKIADDNAPSDDIPQQDNNLLLETEITPVKGDKIVLRFQLTEEKKVPGLDHIDVTFEGVHIRKLWSNFHQRKGSQESEMSQEEMEMFHSALRAHARLLLIQFCVWCRFLDIPFPAYQETGLSDVHEVQRRVCYKT